MKSTPLPSYAQVLQIPALREAEVTPDFIDDNGHMNIRHYLDAGAFGADTLCRGIGIDDAYRAERRRGVFTAEHHIRYYSEMHLGTKLSAHTLLFDRSAKAGHLMSFILDRDAEVLACTVEIILVGVDMDTRRPLEFPSDIAERMDGLIAQARALPWELPLSGAMAIRRR